MNLSVDTDPRSGFCNGVVRAVRRAEEYLQEKGSLFSLGAIVHNASELDRLEKKGLRVIDKGEFLNLRDTTVLIRAHGEPPSTYAEAAGRNLSLIDCTCPVVLRLQERVRDVYDKIAPLGGQIVIFGKRGHAEVNGLVGQTGGSAIVVGGLSELDGIDFSKPTALFSQTTKDPVEFRTLAAEIGRRCPSLEVFDTICRQVSQRYDSLSEFASGHDVVLFVSGRESSNGRVLFDLCREFCPRCHWIDESGEIDPSWFREGDRVGISGATSTPKWQIEAVAEKVRAQSAPEAQFA